MKARREFVYRKGMPWLGVDRREELEEYIAGNREGIEVQRRAAEAALQTGKAELEIPFTDYPGIVLVEGDPREAGRIKPTARDWIAGAFSILIMATLMIGGMALVAFIAKALMRLVFGK